ncbi:MAG: thiamine pyrophosphate-requiring protein [Dehalococcoidales bacterium]|nr:thiamine pyrophosphate-requiring protein [Dehalococcoidales bacterium]
MEDYTTVQTIIEVMNAYGVEFVFFNPGIDNVPFLETISAYRTQGRKSPRSILCLDEFVTMAAAQGNWMASGKPQVVSVHSELGVLQLGGSLHNAQWGRVPLVFFTEVQEPLERRNWKGEPFDQGMMVRSFVKWDHQIKDGEDIGEVFSRAFHIATSEPCGPVYITLPRGVLWEKGKTAGPKTFKAIKEIPLKADENALSRTAEILINAENPLIVTGYSGRNPDAVASLVELAETLAARVMTADTRVNFPNTHPMAAYLSSTVGFGNPLLTKADAILSIDYDMHYAAPSVSPDPNAKIIHIDIDTVKKGVPLWDKKPDILIKADSSHAIPALTEIIKKKLNIERRGQLKKRYEILAAEHNKLDGEWKALAESHTGKKPITPHWLSYCINEAIDDDTIIVNQTISPATTVAHLIRRDKPGTLLSCPGGCIGWAPGAALGAKLAAPDKTVISLMGDGAFIYGCPEATLWSANFYKAPFLEIIYDNQGYGAIKGLFKENYDVDNMGADIASPPDYTMIARANNAYGRMVEDPAEVPRALKECLDIVRGGQTAVLDVRLASV